MGLNIVVNDLNTVAKNMAAFDVFLHLAMGSNRYYRRGRPAVARVVFYFLDFICCGPHAEGWDTDTSLNLTLPLGFLGQSFQTFRPESVFLAASVAARATAQIRPT